MNHPLVVNKYTDPYDVVITRATKWGNPFTIGTDGSREEVIAKFEDFLDRTPSLLAALHELRGKRLGCVCAPKHHCHGDVLAHRANR
jgi:hypothetical protein